MAFKIDPNQLDHECLQQPDLVHQYSMTLAKANIKLKKAMKALEDYRLVLGAKVRDKPEKYGVYKVTEGAVATALHRSEKYKQLQTEVEEAEYAVELAWVDVHAIKSKQQSLTDLVKLHGQSYFSSVPTTPEGVDAILKDKARRKGGVR